MKKITGYYVEEVTKTGAPFTVSYQIGNNAATSTCTPVTSGTVTIINTDSTGSVQVSKKFSGVASLPDTFKITAAWADGTADGASVELTTTGTLPTVDGLTITRTGTGAQNAPHIWTIDGLPIGTEVTFTESGYTVNGYNCAVTVNGTANAENSGNATVSGAASLPETAKVAFVNTYEAGVELPSTGGSGTLPYTLAGLTLLLGASLWLMLRRKKETT